MKKIFSRSWVTLLLFVVISLGPTVAAQEARVSKWPRGITYEIFVESFCDSNGDGIGDIRGMTSKLDYLKELGVEGIWLMPVNPSPSYHKYDVTDYYGIHPDYGTLEDFKIFIKEAHKRNIHVIMDMVLNHSSSQHPWFIDAKNNENSRYRDYYVWTHKDDPQTKAPVKKGFGDSDNSRHWNAVPGSDYLYYSYFGGNMPDLNYDNPRLREEVFKIGRFWLTEIGVDGFRLDAARHIFPEERAIDNHNWWVYFRNEMLKADKDVYIVGEVWAPAPEVAPYMKGIPALFDFDLGFAITRSVNEERGDSLVAGLNRIREFYKTVNPDFIDATFLTNHDQNRIMSAVGNDGNKARMAAALLFTLPGSPYLYYGEELGMMGKKPDPYIREPFLWDKRENDKERAHWILPRYSTDSSLVAERQQEKDPASMLNYYKTFIALRNNSKALTFGEMEPVDLNIHEICSFIRTYEDESLLVIHNLSKTVVDLNLPDSLIGFNKVLFKNKNAGLNNKALQLSPYSTLILKK